MATKTVSTGWSDGDSNFGSIFSDSGGDKYYSMPISTVNSAISGAGIPSNAVVSGVSLTATATIENSMSGRFYLSIGFGGSGSISTTLLNGAQIAYDKMSGSTTQTVSLNAALSNNSINTSKGSYITFRIYSTTWGKKTYKVKDVNLTITYSIPTYTLTVTAGAGGTVTGGGTYNNQATATLTATPNTGYKFVKWSDGNTSATRTVTVTGNATYTAEFEVDVVYCTLELVSLPSEGGTVTGGGTVVQGSTVSLNATPNTGYRFVGWYENSNMIISSAASSITVNSNRTFTARFERCFVIYDSIFSFKRWKDFDGIGSGSGIAVSNLSDVGFTGTATVDDAYTKESSPIIPVEKGKEYTVEFEAVGGNFELFVFNCDVWGAWSGSSPQFTMKSNNKKFNFTAATDYISIRCDVVGTGTVVDFSNFRIYPADCQYMSASVPDAERIDQTSWSMPTPTREGYAFTGWNTKADGSGKKYTSDDTFPTDYLFLYSQWEEAKPEIKNVQMIYLDKQISETNKVPCGEGFVISVELS